MLNQLNTELSIAAIDVHYMKDIARVGYVEFVGWNAITASKEIGHECSYVADYQSGQFFKRELPCIISCLRNENLSPDLIVIDGYVNFDEGKAMGQHLYENLNNNIPIIGIAKNLHKDAKSSYALYRGSSSKPLYITSIGINEQDAIMNIKQMSGEHRIPTLIKKADQLARNH